MKLYNKIRPDIQLNQSVDRLGTILLSIVLALIVWLVAINRENPIVQDIYSEKISISTRGLSDNLGLVDSLNDKTISIEIKAPKNTWDRLAPNDFDAYVDLSGLEDGQYEVPIQIYVSEPGVTIMDSTESTQSIELGKIITQSVPIVIEAVDPAEGYQVEETKYEQRSVMVSGPEQLVSRVVQGTARFHLQDTKQQVDGIRAIAPVDAEGERVEGVEIKPSTIEIEVSVAQIPGRKEVAVNPDLVGQPNDSYRLSSVIVEPNTVVLQGDNEALSKVPGSVFTQPLELTDATAEIRKSLDLVLPPGVKARDGDSVSVIASITPIVSSTRETRKPHFDSLGDGLEAKVFLETVTVILSGPVPQLDALEEDDVRVVLDLSGLGTGIHTVTPRVELPQDISQDGILPETVEVVITSMQRLRLPPTPTKYVPVPSPLETPNTLSNN